MGNSAETELPVHINLMTGDIALLLYVVLHGYIQRLVLIKHLLADFAHKEFVAFTVHGNRILQQTRPKRCEDGRVATVSMAIPIDDEGVPGRALS